MLKASLKSEISDHRFLTSLLLPFLEQKCCTLRTWRTVVASVGRGENTKAVTRSSSLPTPTWSKWLPSRSSPTSSTAGISISNRKCSGTVSSSYGLDPFQFPYSKAYRNLYFLSFMPPFPFTIVIFQFWGSKHQYNRGLYHEKSADETINRVDRFLGDDAPPKFFQNDIEITLKTV